MDLHVQVADNAKALDPGLFPRRKTAANFASEEGTTSPEARRCVRSLALCLVAVPDSLRALLSSAFRCVCMLTELCFSRAQKALGEGSVARSKSRRGLARQQKRRRRFKVGSDLRGGDYLYFYSTVATPGAGSERASVTDSKITLPKLTLALRRPVLTFPGVVHANRTCMLISVSSTCTKAGRPRQEILRFASADAERRSRQRQFCLSVLPSSHPTRRTNPYPPLRRTRGGRVYRAR